MSDAAREDLVEAYKLIRGKPPEEDRFTYTDSIYRVAQALTALRREVEEKAKAINTEYRRGVHDGIRVERRRCVGIAQEWDNPGLARLMERVETNEEIGAVALLIVNQDGDVLAVSRKDDPTDLGLPGGKVEAGESVYDAAVRECVEETGLVPYNMKPVFEAKTRAGMTRCYTAEVHGIISTKEAGVVTWARPEQLLHGTFSEYNQALFDQVGIRYTKTPFLRVRAVFLKAIETVVHKPVVGNPTLSDLGLDSLSRAEVLGEVENRLGLTPHALEVTLPYDSGRLRVNTLVLRTVEVVAVEEARHGVNQLK